MIDYYETLGVSRTASSQEIKKRYKEMAKKYHPDANRNSPESEEKFKAINEAYSVLSSPVDRAEYDSGFYNDNVFYDGSDGRGQSKYNDNRTWQTYSYTFYTNSGRNRKKKYTFERPFFNILKGVVQVFFGGFLMISFARAFTILGLYIAFLGVENVRRGLSSLS